MAVTKARPRPLAFSIATGSNFAYYGTPKGWSHPMSKVEKISVALTPEMAQMVKANVGSGDYASASELIREALREWRQRRDTQAQAREELGKLWDFGLASGAPIDGPSAISGLRAKLKEVV
jgi:antitoxin ParD1/3/4